MNKLKIDVIANDGSPIGVVSRDIYGENGRLGVGGAELALLTLCEGWHKAGHDVALYNNPTVLHGSIFHQYPLDSFLPQADRDVLVIFRSPNKRIRGARGLKVWWSTDQKTVGDFADFATKVDKIVTISPFHAKYFKDTYGIENTTTIDLPVRLDDYTSPIEKVKNRLIFCSVPDRGLPILAQAYREIQQQVPDVSLVITSDYRLWGARSAMNEQHIMKFLGLGGVQFLGAIPRREMVKEQLAAQIQAYPCTYDELFCYSVAECSVAGALPITSTTGALATTNMGIQIEGDVYSHVWRREFVAQVVHTLKHEDLQSAQFAVSQDAKERFSMEKILPQWEKVFENE